MGESREYIRDVRSRKRRWRRGGKEAMFVEAERKKKSNLWFKGGLVDG